MKPIILIYIHIIGRITHEPAPPQMVHVHTWLLHFITKSVDQVWANCSRGDKYEPLRILIWPVELDINHQSVKKLLYFVHVSGVSRVIYINS